MSSRRHLEDQIVQIAKRMHDRGWVANHDGNISARLEDGRILATPTAVSKGDIQRDWLIVVDETGKKVSGRRNSFSEMALHLAIYRQRPNVRAVVHSHSPYATALCVAGIEVCSTMLPEPVVSLGARIPLVPYAAPKTPGFTANLAEVIADGHVDALTLEHHGVLSWGPDLEHAYLRMELVEHLARVQTLTMSINGGAVRTIPQTDIPALLNARKKAGLGA